jgi:hypothetical protein
MRIPMNQEYTGKNFRQEDGQQPEYESPADIACSGSDHLGGQCDVKDHRNLRAELEKIQAYLGL